MRVTLRRTGWFVALWIAAIAAWWAFDLFIGPPVPEPAAFDLKAWFNELFYPLFVRGAFADPIYGGNRDKQAWRMIGYPGLPATYTTDMVTWRGRRHPASDTPMSIQDFS